MNNRNRHFRLALVLAGFASMLTGCQNRQSGLFGSDNWGRNGYANYFLNNGLNPNSLIDGRIVGYIVYGQGSNLGLGGQTNPTVPFNGQSGGVAPLNNPSGPGTGAGGIAGGSTQASAQTACMLKIISGSGQTTMLNQGIPATNQNFGNQYANQLPSSQPFFAVGAKQPITCGKDSEIAATASAFYITGGSNSNNVWVYRMNSQGLPLGASPAIAINAPTKIAASSSGHIAVIADKGHSLVLMYEGNVGTDGGWIADIYHTIPAQNGAIYTDVVFDRQQGAMYVGEQLPGGAGRVQIYSVSAAYDGVFNTAFDSRPDFMNFQSFQPASLFNIHSAYNFEHNLPAETSVDYLFRAAAPSKLKNNNGLTGIFTSMGHPFFMETGLGLSPNETVGKSHEELQQIYQSNRDMTVQDIRVYDPFQISNHTNSSYVQPGFKFKDFAIGKDLAFLITEAGSLYTVYVNSENPFNANTPWERRLPLGKLNTIEMSEDQQIAVVTGSAGISIGRVSGNNLIFSSNGQPDVSEAGGVLHAAVLEKVYKVKQPAAPIAAANKNAAATSATAQAPQQ